MIQMWLLSAMGFTIQMYPYQFIIIYFFNIWVL